MLSFINYTERHLDKNLKPRRKIVKSDAVGSALAGGISLKSTQGVLDTFHNASSTVQRSETSEIVSAPSPRNTRLWFYIKDPTMENCVKWRNTHRFDIMKKSYGVFKQEYLDNSDTVNHILDKGVASLFGVTEDNIIEMYPNIRENVVCPDEEGGVHYIQDGPTKKTSIQYPMFINDPIIPPNINISEYYVSDTFQVEDTYIYDRDLSGNSLYYPIDDLIAVGLINGKEHLLWLVGKPIKLHRTEFGDILEIEMYKKIEYHMLIFNFNFDNPPGDIAIKTYIALHKEEDVILNSIFTTNLNHEWFSKQCVTHMENYRTTLYIIREINDFNFRQLYIHKYATLHLIHAGFRMYVNQDIGSNGLLSFVTQLFMIVGGEVKQMTYTPPLIAELTNRINTFKHPYDEITNIPERKQTF